MHEPLVIDVASSADAAAVGMADLVVIVEPLYGCVAVALALDAGWQSVEIAEQQVDGPPPIPLVSFEQAPAVEHQSSRCRVRSADLARTLAATPVAGPPVVLGSSVNARPLCARIAQGQSPLARVVLLPVGVDGEPIGIDAWWASGMLIRVLLDELAESARPVTLTDAAGLAVALARGAESAAAQLSAGRRWRDHRAAGGHDDDLRVASAVDTVAAVPLVLRANGAAIATQWSSER